jgi:hypothetical protein
MPAAKEIKSSELKTSALLSSRKVSMQEDGETTKLNTEDSEVRDKEIDATEDEDDEADLNSLTIPIAAPASPK